MSELERKVIHLEGYDSREEIQKCYFSNYLVLEDKAREAHSHYLAELKINTIITDVSTPYKRLLFSCDLCLKRLDRKPETNDYHFYQTKNINQLTDSKLIWEISLETQPLSFYKGSDKKGNDCESEIKKNLRVKAGEQKIYISQKLIKESFSTILVELEQVFDRIFEFAKKEGDF